MELVLWSVAVVLILLFGAWLLIPPRRDDPPNPPSSVERWVSWVVFFSAIVLGLVLLWALGWSRGFGPIGSDGPVHAMTRDPCERPDVALLLAGVALAGVGGVSLIARATKRGGWWQVGLWAGFILIADTLLMFQYMRFIPNPPCNFD